MVQKTVVVRREQNVRAPTKERCVLCGRRMGPQHPPSKDDGKVCCVCDQQGLKQVAVKKPGKKKVLKKVNPLS